MSPVFPPPSACEDLGGGKIRPVMLVSVALTNEPNIKGGRPIANREPVANRGGDAKKYRWVLGNPPSGEHCGVCLARAGKVKTGPEWAAMGMPPCNCHCSLEEVDDETANRWTNIARAASLAGEAGEGRGEKEEKRDKRGKRVKRRAEDRGRRRGGAEETGCARGGQAGFDECYGVVF